MTFRLTMYPGMDGDCLLLSWGTGRTLHHILVDLGRGATYKAVRGQLVALENIELFVMSHIDADHIAGAIPMVREKAAPIAPKRLWYNARAQLVAATDRIARVESKIEAFGARQGEKLASGIVKFQWPWNAEFASEIVSTDSPEASGPISIADGLTIRLLSPTDAALKTLLPVWDAELKAAKIAPFDPDEDEDPLSPKFEPLDGAPNVKQRAAEPYAPDHAEPNGSAIAFIAEFGGKRVLLAADAHSEILEAALAPLARAEGGRYRVDLLKVSHHGAPFNTSKTFPTVVDCTRFAISSSGARHDHPHPATVARFLVADPQRDKRFYFNYRQPQTDTWDSPGLKAIWKYDCVFPVTVEADPVNGTLVIDI